MDDLLKKGAPTKTVAPRGFRKLRECLLVATTFFAFADAGLAQSSNTVTLKYDNGDRISGEFIEVTQGGIRLQTLMGVVSIPLAEVTCEGAACPSGASGQSPVILTALDGSFKVVGNLIEMADNQYVIATEVGDLKIDIDQASCTGIGCVTEVEQPTFGGVVTLTDGNAVIEGRLMNVEDGSYIIDVETLGTIRVSSEVFQCTGASCP